MGCQSPFEMSGKCHVLHQFVSRAALSLALLWLVGCGGSSPTKPQNPPIPTASTPSPLPTSFPSPTPTVPPVQFSPTPSPIPSSPCDPPPGVQPVSPVQINLGNTTKHEVALTIDPYGTEELSMRFLEILARHQVHATWFPEGSEALQGPERIRQVQAYGDVIGNHTMSHPHLTPLSDEAVCREIEEAEQAIVSITDQTTRPYFRPPYGDVDARVRDLAAQLGYRTVCWSIDTEDYQPDATSEAIVAQVMNHLSNGAIILIHTTEVEAQTLDQVITLIQQQGYQIVTLDELLA
jgi:peptidoglycan/xylan/chitin deacetylase (PgdA/CDA1 family)